MIAIPPTCRAAAAAAAVDPRRDHGHSDRAARRAAHPQGDEDARRRRPVPGDALRHFRRQGHPLRAAERGASERGVTATGRKAARQRYVREKQRGGPRRNDARRRDAASAISSPATDHEKHIRVSPYGISSAWAPCSVPRGAVFPHGSVCFPKREAVKGALIAGRKTGVSRHPMQRAASGGRRPLTASKLRKFTLP